MLSQAIDLNKDDTASGLNKQLKIQKDLVALIKNERWQEAIKFVRSENVHCTESSAFIFISLAINAFNESNGTLGWEMLEILAGKGHFNPICELLTSYWNFCAKNENTFNEQVERMLMFISKNQIPVPRNVLQTLDEKLEQFGGVVHKTHIDVNGNCEKCKTQLIDAKLSSLEFHTFKMDFEKLIVKKFVNQSELNIFKQLVNKNKIFDYVIDSLNVSRIGPPNKGNLFRQGNMLVKIIDCIRRRSNRIFVVGKQHIKDWPEHATNYVNRNSTIFLTNGKTDIDDIFMMYATLISGPKANFVTNDMLTEYPKYFGESSQTLFKRWQKQHQLTVSFNQKRDEIIFQKLSKFREPTNGCEHWHIPYFEEPFKKLPKHVVGSHNWTCIELKKN